MDNINRRQFIRTMGSAAVTAELAAAGLMPRRIFGDETSKFTRIAYRQLGSTGFKVSEIGFGGFGGTIMKDPALVHAAIDSGINYIDTAHSYMNGVNEKVIGEVMKTKRGSVFLTTKVRPKNPETMLARMETSLKRLQTDHVDLFLLHDLKKREQILDEKFMAIFDKALQKGICRFVGISMHTNQAELLDAAMKTGFWQAALVGYNPESPPGVAKAIEKARKAGFAIITMKSIMNPSNWPWVPLKDIRTGRNGKMTPAQALIRWVLEDPYVDVTIPGMTSFEHLHEDLAVMGMKIRFGDRGTLFRYGEHIRGSYCRGVAGCTGCSGQCPHGVSINELNRCLSYACGYGDIELARENYANLPQSSRVDRCAGCGECVVKCVYGLDLNDTVRRARELFA